jgi:hypothetical protein
MRTWVLLLGGLTIWAVHFFALYAIASLLPGQPQARWWALAATVPALLACALILRRLLTNGGTDPLDRWAGYLATLGAATALLAILWQVAPVLLI